MSALKDILLLLPKLTAAEREQVRLRLGALAPAKAGKVPQDDWLLEGITDELRRRGLWMRRRSIPSELLPKTYSEASEAARAYMLKGLGKQQTRTVERQALGRLAAAVLADYLLQLRRPITPNTMVSAVSMLPQALDAAFPGYWATRALAVCIKLRTE